jgi:hypothetical protein
MVLPLQVVPLTGLLLLLQQLVAVAVLVLVAAAVVGAVVVRSGPHSTISWDIWVMLLLGASLASFCGS